MDSSSPLDDAAIPPEWQDRCHFGDCRALLPELARQGMVAQTCITSPPYFGLRSYGVPTTVWGGDPTCGHTFSGAAIDAGTGRGICRKCGAWSGDLGLEPTLAMYVSHLVEVFRAVRDVLADDGVLWLNLGDSYASGGRKTRATDAKLPQRALDVRPSSPLPDKSLLGVPWRVAFALQDDGWILRQDIVWQKLNPLPESVRDRCTKSHEFLFLFSKRPSYYWDREAMQEPSTGALAGNRTYKYADTGDVHHRSKEGLLGWAERQRTKRDSFRRENSKRAEIFPGQSCGTHRPDRPESTYDTNLRNRRDVWAIAAEPYRGAHFAVMPKKLVIPCVLAGSRIGDTVLDPFVGSGTVPSVAQRLGRHWVGCELNPGFDALQKERIGTQVGMAFSASTNRKHGSMS